MDTKLNNLNKTITELAGKTLVLTTVQYVITYKN